MAAEMVFVVLAIGAFFGFYLGRWWSERQRGRFEMQQARDRRNSYRDGPFNGLF